LKSYWPILLGLGLGIRLARTHYDAKTEKDNLKRKKEEERKKVEEKSVVGAS